MFLLPIFSHIENISLADTALPGSWNRYLIGKQEIAGPGGNTETEILKNLFWGNLLPMFRYIFIGVSLIFFGIYAGRLVINFGEEDEYTTQRKNLLFGVVGFALIGMATQIALIFDPTKNTATTIVDIAKSQSVVQQVINYLEIGLGVVALVVLLYSAILLITAREEEEKITSAKNYLKYSLIGFGLVVFADILVNRVFYPNLGSTSPGEAQISAFVEEGFGVLSFFFQFLAAIVFIAFIVAGFYFLTAGDDDDQREKAKKILIWSALGVILILIAYPVTLFFLPK
ncbi:MAG: hypothetical protein WCJ84_02915 [Candidatus Peregrinibacteria bacterium]